jgi:hypothetical protein
LSTIDGERGIKGPHQVFLDEELGPKSSIKNSWPHSEMIRMAGPKSKSGCRSLDTAIHPVRMLHGMERIMITIFFARCKLIVLNILLKGRNFNHIYFVNYNFPNLKRKNMNFHPRSPRATCWVRIDKRMCHNGSKVA